RRNLLFQPGFWVMSGVAALSCVPILIWNAQHDWVSFRHVGGQAGLNGPHGLIWLGPLTYLAVQFAVLFGFWFIGWAAAMLEAAPWRETNANVTYLWWLSAPMFLFFLAFSLITVEEANWPVTAYV